MLSVKEVTTSIEHGMNYCTINWLDYEEKWMIVPHIFKPDGERIGQHEYTKDYRDAVTICLNILEREREKS